MLQQCLEFFLMFFAKFFSWLDNSFMLSSNVSWLGVLVAVFIIIVIIDNFVPKG